MHAKEVERVTTRSTLSGSWRWRGAQPLVLNSPAPCTASTIAVGRLGWGFGGGDRATTFGHSEISIRSSSFFSPTPEELLKADAWTDADGQPEREREREREEPNLLRSDANDMKSHSLSLWLSLALSG